MPGIEPPCIKPEYEVIVEQPVVTVGQIQA